MHSDGHVLVTQHVLRYRSWSLKHTYVRVIIAFRRLERGLCTMIERLPERVEEKLVVGLVHSQNPRVEVNLGIGLNRV